MPDRQVTGAPTSRAAAPRPDLRRTVRLVVAAVLLLNAFVAALVGQGLWRSYRQREAQAALAAQGLARLLERSLQAVLDKVDLALLAVQDEHARVAAGRAGVAELEAALARQKGRCADLLSIRVTDAAGRVDRGVPVMGELVSVDDRDYFTVHREGDRGLFISRPALGRIIQVPRVVFSRRLSRPDGDFAGVVFASISLDHIATILGEVELGPHGAALLRYRDLTAVVRRANGRVEPYLEPAAPSPQLREQLAAGQSSGLYSNPAPKDGVRRTYAWRQVGYYPFIVMVGLAQRDLLAGWWTELAQAAGQALLFAVATGLGAAYAVRTLRRQAAADEALRHTELRLQQAQRLETVGRLAGGVAHDFNNMLAVILGEAELLAGDLPPDHPGQASVREIAHAGARSRDLTRQLLAFSRRQAIAPRVVNLNRLVEATRPALKRLLGEDVALDFQPDPELPAVKVDPGQFDQVLVNLVVNARDAIAGRGRIAVRTARATLGERPGPGLEELRPGEYAVLAVTDDGHGMDPQTLAHVFEPFFTTKAQGRGTGLGLATTYGIARQNGGAILAESAPGQGATFRIYLPATAERPEEPDHPAPPPAPGRGTILLVEDEAPVRRTTRKLLESLGYQVLEAASGEEAAALARGAAIDLLVSDVALPGMKGPEIARRVQALRPGLPVLFISGHAEQVTGRHGVVAEDVRLLCKPFGLQELARQVEEALRAAGPAVALAAAGAGDGRVRA